jgi:hypothetical protein
MPKFFQSEIAAFDGDKAEFQNVKFKRNDFTNTSAAEGGGVLEFIPVHIRNPPVIQFVAYIESISDRFGANFSQESPFGRTNPFYIWEGNSREISLNVDIPASGISKALDNLNNLSWLLASLYPSYKDSTNATSVAASPLHRVRYGNLICSSTNNGQGLLCVLQGATVTHDTSHGFIHVNPKNMGSSFANTAGRILTAAKFENHVSENKHFIIPKLMKLSLNLSVVQDHPLGWDFYTGEFRGGRGAPGFPYDLPLVNEAADPPTEIGAGSSTTESPTSTGTAEAGKATKSIMREDTDPAGGSGSDITRGK